MSTVLLVGCRFIYFINISYKLLFTDMYASIYIYVCRAGFSTSPCRFESIISLYRDEKKEQSLVYKEYSRKIKCQ